MIAVFFVLLWLIPLDATSLPIRLPFDSTADRFALGVLALTWLTSLGTPPFGPHRRRSAVNVAMLVFVGIAAASTILNLTTLAREEELVLAIKKLSLLACSAAFFLIIATSIRRCELPRFLVLILALPSLTALGTIIEYRTNVNYFFEWAHHIPLLQIAPEPLDPTFGRPAITGPTQHGLAVTTILAMAMPIAVVKLIESPDRTRRLLFALALGVLLAGTVSTLRKSAIVLPFTALLTLALYRPRQMLKLLPLGVVLAVMIHLISPGAISGIRYELAGGSKDSTEGRTADYAAVRPDVMNRPLLGRGYGTYDPKIHLQKEHLQARHRTLDNELLLLLIEVGVIGLAAYLAIVVLGITMLHPLARRGDALVLIAGSAAFVVSNVLFDALSFSQVSYLYFCFLGFAVVATTERTEQGSHRPSPYTGRPRTG